MDREKWLDTAVSGIRFGPDRGAVRAELLAHIEDKEAGLRRVFPDIPEEEARKRALADMGDAGELKASLAKVHRPWLGWLWTASRWLLMGTWLLYFISLAGIRSGFDNTPNGRTAGSVIYHRVDGGDQARLGGYTFQITGAAYLDRPEADNARDTLQVVLRVSSPRFWERVDGEAVLRGLTVTAPNAERYPMDRAAISRYTIMDEWGNRETRQYYRAGAELSRWGVFNREFAIYVPAEGWEPGSLVTLELESELGGFTLSAPVTEKVRAQ